MKHTDYLKKKKNREIRRRVVSILSAIVVFVATYALVLPALTLDVKTARMEPGMSVQQEADPEAVSAPEAPAEEEAVEESTKEEEPAEAVEPEKEEKSVKEESAKEDQSAQAEEQAPAEEASKDKADEAAQKEDAGQADADSAAADQAPAKNDSSSDAVDQSGADAAEENTKEAAAEAFKVPELEAIDFNEILTDKTDFYYYHADKDEDAAAVSSTDIDDWKKATKDTVLAPEDFVRVYLAYTIPAGALNETNATASYRLPDSLELTDKQIKAINKNENGISGTDKDAKDYKKYLGAEAIEGTRTPDKSRGDDEYISATVKVEKVYKNDKYVGQELVFTFAPYTVQKNQISYDDKGNVKSEGKAVKGWFSFDLTPSRIDFEETEDAAAESGLVRSEAKITFVKENNKKDIDEISRALALDAPADTVADKTEEKAEQAAEQKTLTYEGPDYTVIINYTDDAQIPDNAELAVSEIGKDTPEYKDYLEQAKAAVKEDKEDKTVNEARFFDITILADGEKVEPAAPVSVQINFAGIEQTKAEDAQLLHYKDDEVQVMEKAEFGKSDEAGSNAQAVDTVQFEADGFSVYGIVGTETITAQVITESGDTLQVTVEVTDVNDIVRFNGLRVNELTANDPAYWTAYDAVVAEKQKNDENFDEETFGFFAADIELLDADGEAFEPEGIVNVKMELISLPADANTLTSTMEVQHLAEKDGEIDVQTVATVNDVTTVNDVITTQFDVESFSTFTLTWTGEGESEVISDDDAKAVLNVQSGSDTYATVNIHYVDEYGHNIRSPFTTSVNGTTPVTIEGLLDGEITGYEYQGAYYNTYTGEETDQAVNSIAVSRTSSESTGTEYVYVGTTGNNGRINNSTTQPAGYTEFYEDANGNTQIYWITGIVGNQNNRFHTRTTNLGNGTRYSGTVYGARTGTVTNYSYTLSFDNTDIEELTNTNTSGTWEEAADIYLVYKSTDSNLKHATIHFGTVNSSGQFTELQETASLDTNAASISLSTTISGYEYVGAYYRETATNVPATDSVEILSTLRKVEDSWQYTDTSSAAEKGFVENNSHIYAIYKEKSESHSTPDEGEIPTPSTIKNVTDNGNGTYDIQLDIIGQQIVHEETKGANVLLIFDRTSSMSSSMSGADNRFAAAKSAVHTLVNALNPGTNPVQLAVFSFDRFANTPYSSGESYWTTDGSAITGFTDALTMAASGQSGGLNGGTNWEAAMEQAATVLATADNDPTYVIFLTDGNPTIHNGNASQNGGIDGSPTENSQCYTRARTAANNLDTKYKIYNVLCANQSDGPLLQTLTTYLTNQGHTASHILANDATTLTNTFNNIAQYIVEQLGASNVSTNDGVTSLSSVSASVSGAAGAFSYYKAYEVTLEDGKYTYVGDDGKEHEVTAADVNTYTYVDSEGDEQTYLYYNRQVWEEAPGASYNPSTGVTWDLSSESTLNEGAIYSIRFTIWPSQAAYDLLADLNNGIKVYEPGHENSITDSERNQVYESGGVYYMKTNTNLDTSYSFAGSSYTDSIPYHQGAMDLDSEDIFLLKQWPENMLDQYGAATYRDENGVEHTATEITLTLTKDKVNYLPVTVKASEGWKKGDVYISCGVMTVDQNGVADIKEHGHDYTVTEPAGFSYYWDLIADVYHPMVINGVTTMLILDEEATDSMVDNSTYFKIDGKIYKKQEAEELVLKADNYRRSNLNITKKIEPANPNAPENAKFTYSVAVTDAESTDGYVWFSAWDPVAGATVKDTSWVKSGATAEAGNTGYWYAPNGGTVVFEIEAGWNVRFLNLKHDSTFSIEETGSDDGFSFVKAEESVQYQLVKEVEWCDIDGAKAEGTIPEPNNSYTVTYTNKYDTIDIQLKKVDEKNQTLSGATFTLARQQDTTWVNVIENIKPGDSATSTANPVDLGGLGVGNYRLTETKAPDGYIILSNHVDFEVYKEGTELKARLADGTQHATIEGPGTGDTPTYTITVENTPGQALPMTGGSGTLPYTLGGFALIMASALMYGFRMRRRERRLN